MRQWPDKALEANSLNSESEERLEDFKMQRKIPDDPWTAEVFYQFFTIQADGGKYTTMLAKPPAKKSRNKRW